MDGNQLRSLSRKHRLMVICIGSKNPNKFNAVKEAFLMFETFRDASFVSIGADSNVSDQPVGYTETITGAKNRAFNAFKECDISVGLESGLVEIPLTKTGYMNLTVCSIYDGQEHSIGTGPAFELPEKITKQQAVAVVVTVGKEIPHPNITESFCTAVDATPRFGGNPSARDLLRGQTAAGKVTRNPGLFL